MPSMDSVFSDSSGTHFGDLSLSCSFSSVEEHRQTLGGEKYEEIVQPHQFEPQASKSLVWSLAASTLGDGDSIGIGGGRLGNTACSNK